MVDDGFMNTYYSAGETSERSISFSCDELKLRGIYTVNEIKLVFMKRDENFKEERIELAPIHTSSYGKADSYDMEYGFLSTTVSAEENYKNVYSCNDEYKLTDDIKVIREFVAEQYDDLICFLEVENNSDNKMEIHTSGTVLNGLTVSAGEYDRGTINAHSHSLIGITLAHLDSDEFNFLGIKEIGQIGLTVTVYEEEGVYPINEGSNISLTLSGRSAELDLDAKLVYEGESLKIYSLGLVEDDDSGNYNLKLLFENTGDEFLQVNDYDNLSVNDCPTDFFALMAEVGAGTKTIDQFEIKKDSCRENGCNSIDDIKKIEIQVNIMTKDYHHIDEPVITIEF